MDWFFEAAFMSFHLCMLAILILIVSETLGIYLGYRPSNLIRNLIPSWIKDSPILRLKISRYFVLLFFLVNLSFAGYFIQLLSFALKHQLINSGLIFIPASILAWFFTLFMLHCLDQVIRPHPQQATAHSLVGRYATILNQAARPDCSATARVRDQCGELHYVQVVPQFGEFDAYTEVILVDYAEACYVVKKITPQLSQTG